MCELLALSFSHRISATISLNEFQKRGDVNPDGWGVAFYDQNLLQLVKEPRSSVESRLFDFAETSITADTIISHVRRSTCGERSYVNTHPFYRRFLHGDRAAEYAFAHNGTIQDVDCFVAEKHPPLGTTDSERIFCYLLDRLAERNIDEWTTSDFRYLESELNHINDGSNTMNCVLSDGNYLFCYSDENDHNDGLRYAVRSSPFEIVRLTESRGELGTVNLNHPADNGGTEAFGLIVVTKALTSTDWTELNPGELMVGKKGRILYPEYRRNPQASTEG